MEFKQRDIILIPFPYTDLSAIKKRPVFIISNNYYNNKYNDIVVAAITSKEFHDEYSLIIEDSDLEYGILPEKSIIKTGKLFTVNKFKIIKKFSILRNDKFNELQLILSKLFEIS